MTAEDVKATLDAARDIIILTNTVTVKRRLRLLSDNDASFVAESLSVHISTISCVPDHSQT